MPPGVPHVWSNPGATPARLMIRFRPALRAEAMFESFFGLAQDGKVDPQTGRAGLLQTAVLLWAFRREVRLPVLPAAVQRVLVGAIAALGRRLGYRDSYAYPYPVPAAPAAPAAMPTGAPVVPPVATAGRARAA